MVVALGLVFAPFPGSAGAAMQVQAGRVTLNDTSEDPTFNEVCFDQAFSSVPMVFALNNDQEHDPAGIRIRNVTASGFEIAQVEPPDEPPDEDGTSDATTVHFVAAEPGEHTLANGTQVVVDSLATTKFQSYSGSNDWETRTFPSDFDGKPAILSQIQTMENESGSPAPPDGPSVPWLQTTIDNVQKDKFDIALERGQTTSGSVDQAETIGYLAIEAGESGQLTSDIDFESIRPTSWWYADRIYVGNRGVCYDWGFNSSYGSAPLVVASQNTRNANNGSWQRRCSLDTDVVGLRADEDRANDDERFHQFETTGILVLSGSFGSHDCPEIDRYVIGVGGGNASTCAARTINITAKDTAGNTITDYEASVDITTSSGHGTWSNNDADGSLTDATADDGAAGYGFVASDSGTIDLDLTNQHADDLTITVTESDGAPSSTSATLSFRHNAFIIEPRSTLANKANDDLVAGLDQPFQATLVRRKPANSSGQCAIATEYDDANQDVKLWIDRHAADPGGNAPAANGTSLSDSEPGSSNITLDFSSSTLSQAGRAPFDLATSDVGKYALRMEDTTFAEDAAGASQGPRTITGDTSDHVVRPFGLRIVANGNPGASQASGPVFRTAGTDFDVTVAGVQYASADDDGGDNGTADDGVPDGHTDSDATAEADLTDNAVTPSFGQEGTTETAEVGSRLVAPSGGTKPALDGGEPLTFSAFAGGDAGDGAATRQTSWGEVGILELEATLTNYLASGADLSGRSGEVGRFTPDRLTLSTNDPTFRDATGVWSSPFTYMGQAFTFDPTAQPEITVTAVNAEGTTTDNYGGQDTDDDFWKLATPERSYSDATDPNSVKNADFTADQGPGTTTWDNGDGTDTRADYDGQGTLTIRDDQFTYDRVDAATKQVPFDARIDLTLPESKLKDSDNVCLDANDDGSCESFTLGPVSGTELRYGRLVIENASGSELTPVELPVWTEYWAKGGSDSDGNWEVNDKDNDIALTLASEIDLTNEANTVAGDQSIDLADAPNGGSTKINTASPVEISAGEAVLEFEAPGEDDTGWVTATPQLSAKHPYLQYDWPDDKGDVLLDDNPSARATFGIYTGPLYLGP